MSAKSKDLCISFFLQLREPPFRQIFPGWVHADNQPYLLDLRPAFQLFFPRNGILHPLEFFPIHQTINFVPAGKAFKCAGLVLEYALRNMAGNARV